MVTSVTNLGRSGLYDWLVQRATAVILLVYVLCVTGFLLSNPDMSYAQWHAYFNSISMRVFSLLTLVAVVAHAWIGLWQVTTDYLTERQIGSKAILVRLVVQTACGITAFTYLVWGIQVLWG
jgi:succinate dehydrogenase / fumarate reductase membrane anchor subunit